MIMKSETVRPAYDAEVIFNQIQSDDTTVRNDAMATIIEEHANLVYSIAAKYRNYGLSFADLVAEGNIGLMKAADKYKSNHGVEFTTYACYWIRESITRALDNKGKMIRIPCQTAQKMRKLHSIETELKQQLDREPTDSELSKQSGYSLKQIDNLRRAKVSAYPFTMLNPQNENAEKPVNLEAEYPDNNTNTPVEMMINKDSQHFFYNLIEQLGERESKIIKMYFGLESHSPQTHLSISKHVGVSRERVRQIHKESLYKLRRMMNHHVEEIMPIFSS